MRRVAVTGWGLVSPWGTEVQAMAQAVFTGRSAVRPLALRDDGPWPERTAVWLEGFNPREHFSAVGLGTLDRASQFALVAARAALAMAGHPEQTLAPEDCGIHVGTGMGSAGTTESTYHTFFAERSPRIKPLTVPTGMHNAAAAQLALETGFAGANLTYCCACASSAVAIGEAMRRIRQGDAELMLAGGTEALLLPGVVHAWEALRTLAVTDARAPETSCKPFSRQRSGLVLGEGATFFVLEAWDAALARGAQPLAELVGYATGSDSGHLTRPSPAGQARAMSAALRDARVRPEQIGYINAHGTATIANDSSESSAIHAVFGEQTASIPVSSTKAVHGHLMGASAALELLVVLLALRDQQLPPTAHLDDPDPLCALDHVTGAARAVVACEYAMSNSFAFGGTTGVLIARRAG